MVDAFSFIFSVFGSLVSWLFSNTVSITISDYTASIGALLCASVILSILVGSLLSYFKGPGVDFPTRVSLIGRLRSRGR